MFWLPSVGLRCRHFARWSYISRSYHGVRSVCPHLLGAGEPASGSGSVSVLNVKTCRTFRQLLNAGRYAVHGRRFSGCSILNARKFFELSSSPFGEIVINSRTAVDTTVLPLDPQKYPLQNKVIISVECSKDKFTSDDVQISQDGATVRLTINGGEHEKSKTVCMARLPVKFDIGADIKGNSNISIEKFENEHVNIHTEAGSCRLKSIQTGVVDVESRRGNISCEGVLQGNSNLKIIESGNITLHRVQGLTFKAETNLGNIDAKAVYADKSQFITKSGDVHLGSCHRSCLVRVKETGNVCVGSLDGDISVEVGDGDVKIDYVAQHENLSVETEKGDIAIKMSEKLKSYVNLEGPNVELAEEFDAMIELDKIPGSDDSRVSGVVMGSGYDDKSAGSDLLGATSRTLTARTGQGNITINCADWISSLNLMAKLE